jgi:zinc protease
VPIGADAAAVVANMTSILSKYGQGSVPPELVEAAKRKEIADAAFRRNSIPDLAATWS